jgi:hypothetical protein
MSTHDFGTLPELPETPGEADGSVSLHVTCKRCGVALRSRRDGRRVRVEYRGPIFDYEGHVPGEHFKAMSPAPTWQAERIPCRQ